MMMMKLCLRALRDQESSVAFRIGATSINTFDVLRSSIEEGKHSIHFQDLLLDSEDGMHLDRRWCSFGGAEVEVLQNIQATEID